jgi:phosphate-selective porin OprO and OprP
MRRGLLAFIFCGLALPAHAATYGPGFRITSDDQQHVLAFQGRYQWDAGFVTNDAAPSQKDNHGTRRARFGIKGYLFNDWHYNFLPSYEQEQLDIQDAYVTYKGFDKLQFKFGQFKEFNSIEDLSSDLDTILIEPSQAVTTFRPLRNAGAGLLWSKGKWATQLGIFGNNLNKPNQSDDGHSYTARVNTLVYGSEESPSRLHLGFSQRYRVIDSPNNTIRFRLRGETRVLETALVTTGSLTNIESVFETTTEAFWQHYAFTALAEYDRADLNRKTAADLTFDAAALTLSYVLTGEQRSYSLLEGEYDSIEPREPFSMDGNGLGAWEVAARASTLNLNDGDVKGGKINAYSAGLNWYPNEYLKFMANYIYNDLDAKARFPDKNPQFLLLRAQTAF